MKKIIFLFLVTLPVISRAQFFVDLGAGVAIRSGRSSDLNDEQRSERSSDLNVSKRSVLPAVKISAGYQIKNIVLEAEERPAITREVNAPNYFGAKAGVNIGGFVPAAGYYFNFRNEDNPENNHGSFGYSLEYQVMINDRGGLYAEGMVINKSFQITAGAHIEIK